MCAVSVLSEWQELRFGLDVRWFAKHNNGVVDVANMEMYADGWIDIPNGLSELINDLEKYDMVTLLTLDGLTTSDLRTLVDGAHLLAFLSRA